MAELNIVVDTAQAVRAITQAQNKLRTFQGFFDDAEKYLRMQTREQFETEGARLGTPWPRLKQVTIQQRRRDGYAGAILNRTGHLKNSFQVVEKSNIHLVWSSKVPYYQYHQKGTSKMQRRAIIGLNDQTERELKKLLQVFLNEATNG